MATYSIKDLENLTGIKAHTLRIWEKRYNVLEPKRTDTNIRYYDDEDLKKLLNVCILNRNGYKISNIANFSNQAISEKVVNFSKTQNDLETQIESMVIAMIELDEFKFDKVFNNAVMNFGFEETIIKLIYPFLNKIGILWLIGKINPAQEHFISNLLRHRLIVAIDGLNKAPDPASKSFLLFLPEGEYHELGLLFYHYLIKKNNQNVYYLGESVPLEALTETKKIKKFDFILTSVTTSVTNDEMNNFLQKLSLEFQDAKLYITGKQTETLQFSLPPNVILIDSVISFKKELSAL